MSLFPTGYKMSDEQTKDYLEANFTEKMRQGLIATARDKEGFTYVGTNDPDHASYPGAGKHASAINAMKKCSVVDPSILQTLLEAVKQSEPQAAAGTSNGPTSASYRADF